MSSPPKALLRWCPRCRVAPRGFVPSRCSPGGGFGRREGRVLGPNGQDSVDIGPKRRGVVSPGGFWCRPVGSASFVVPVALSAFVPRSVHEQPALRGGALHLCAHPAAGPADPLLTVSGVGNPGGVPGRGGGGSRSCVLPTPRLRHRGAGAGAGLVGGAVLALTARGEGLMGKWGEKMVLGVKKMVRGVKKKWSGG